jgi:hypothetical protein
VFNQSSSGTAPQQIEQEIHVPRGAQLPAAIVDEGAGLQPAQAAAADAIADSFLNAIEQGGSGNGVSTGNKPSASKTGKSAASVWDSAREQADARYRALFGDSAYNAHTISARLEAMAEQ